VHASRERTRVEVSWSFSLGGGEKVLQLVGGAPSVSGGGHTEEMLYENAGGGTWASQWRMGA